MQNVLLKIKKRKEYESQLRECTKPFIPMSERVDTYLKFLDNVAKNYSAPIHCYFYWYRYFECMMSEVVIPLLRAYNLILKRHYSPLLFIEDYTEEPYSPCTYSEAFNFFQTISVSDRKNILSKWASPTLYVSLMDCIEHGDSHKFAELFSETEDVITKLSSINVATHLLPMQRTLGCIIDALSIEDDMSKMDRVIKVVKIEEIEEGYEWNKVDSICEFLEDLISEIAPEIKDFTNSIRSNQTAKRIYERLFYPCIKANSYSYAQELKQVTEIQKEWGNAREFRYFWKNLADLSFALIVYLLFHTVQICLSEKEREVISSIINNPEKAIPSFRLNAIIRLMSYNVKKSQSDENHHKEVIQSSADGFKNIKLIGMPYFEAAKKDGLIIEDGEFLKWTKTTVLLAYFCGRIYCNDWVQEGNKYRDMAAWISGGKHFPEKNLEKLFNVSNLGQQRRNRTSNESAPPEGYAVIDRIIDNVNKNRSISNSQS